MTRHAPSSSRTTEKPSSAGRSTTNGSGSGSSARASSIELPSRPRTRRALLRGRRPRSSSPSNVELGGDVGLGPDDQARTLEQLGPVATELVEQDPLLLLGRAPVDRREVEQEDEHPRPLDVAEELVAEAAALGRALDEAGDVGEHELVVAEAHHAEVAARAW